MLVNLYKSKTPIAVFTLPVLIGILALPVFFIESKVFPNFFSWQSDLSQYVRSNEIVHYIVLVSIVFLSAIEINRLVNTFGFYSKNTYLAGAIYMLILFGFGRMTFSVTLIAYGLLIYGLSYLFRINRQDSAISSVFMSSFFFGSACVFEPFLFPIVLLPWFSLVVFRSFVWREWAILLLGILIPWGYHYGIYFIITGELRVPIDELTMGDLEIEMSLPKITIVGYAFAMAFYAVWRYLVIAKNQLLVFKKRSRMLFHLIWLTTVSMVLGWFFYDYFLIAVAVPLTVIITVQLLNSKQALTANLSVLFWLALALWNLIFTFR